MFVPLLPSRQSVINYFRLAHLASVSQSKNSLNGLMEFSTSAMLKASASQLQLEGFFFFHSSAFRTNLVSSLHNPSTRLLVD